MIETHFDDQLIQYIKLKQNVELMSMLQNRNLCHSSDNKKSTLLHYAAEYGNEVLAQYLINLELNVNARNCNGETPLHLAVKGCYSVIVTALIKAKADIFITNVNGETVLGKIFRMSKTSESDTFESIIKHIILSRVTLENLSTSKHVEKKAFHEDCPLNYFVTLKNIEMTRVLLEKGSPVDARERKTQKTALHVVVENLDVEHVKLLLEYNADVNVRDCEGNRPLYFITHYKIQGLALEIMKLLIDAGASLIDHDPQERLMTLFFRKGNRKVVRFLLERIDLNVKNKQSSTPMHYLFENEDSEVYKELQNFKVKLKVFLNGNPTILHFLAANGNVMFLQLFLDIGAHVNFKDSYGRTALCMALEPIKGIFPMTNVIKNRRICIEKLLKYGADPQILTKENSDYILSFKNLSLFGNIELMSPILMELALQKASGRAIQQLMLDIIEMNFECKSVLESSKCELEEMKKIKIDEALSLFDFLVAKKVLIFPESEILVSKLKKIMNENSFNSYYCNKMHENFFKLTRILAVNEVFVKYFNISVINIAEKIIDYT